MQRKIEQVLRPVIDTYIERPIAIIGCHSYEIARESCEYDLLVVGEKDKKKTLRLADELVDIIYATEQEILSPDDPEFALLLSFLAPVRDTTFSLSTCFSYARTMQQRNFSKACEKRLKSCLKTVGRCEESLKRDSRNDSSFWLTLAGYDLAYAWLYSNSKMPAPSHLVEQMMKCAKDSPEMYELIVGTVGLELANSNSIKERHQSLIILYDTIEKNFSYLPEAPEVVNRKVTYLLENKYITECFSYLGLKLIEALLELSRLYSIEEELILSSMIERNILSKKLTRSMFFEKTDEEITEKAKRIRDQTLKLAKEV